MLRNNHRLAGLIREARKRKGWSQADLAKRLGYGQAWIAHLETGRLKTIAEDIYRKLAHILGLAAHKMDRGGYFPPEEKRMAASEAARESVLSGASHRTTIKKPVEQKESSISQKIRLSVEGPWEIPHEKGPGGYRLLPRNNGGRRQTVLSEKGMSRDLQAAKGIYIFAIKVAGSYIPIYVGKAVKQGFARECFNDRNQNLYKEGLTDHEHGTPVMFFIVAPKKRGAANGKIIADIEKALITMAWFKNPDLVNKHHARCNWSIGGVTGNGRDETSNAAQALGETLGLSHK